MKESNYKLGLVSVSFRQHTPFEILTAAKKAGLSCIEWGSDVHAPFNDIVRLTEIAKMQEEYGISCSSYGTYFCIGGTPISELESYIKAAKILRTNTLRLWCGSKCGNDYSADEKQNFFIQCKQAAEIAEQHGVTLCMECHIGSYTERLNDALELMHTVNSKYFQMYWQPFQWQTQEENLKYAEAIAPFTRTIHVFQWGKYQRFSLYEGINEWQKYLSKFSESCTLLLEFMPDDKITSLLNEANALKTIIGENL